MIRRENAPDADTLCTDLYAGDLFLLSANTASQRLIGHVHDLLNTHFGDRPRLAHQNFDDATFFNKVGAIRRDLFYGAHIHESIRALLAEVGFDLDRVAYDPPRLRAIKPGGEDNPRAAAVYYAHRDTWYGHPASMITWWLPTHDLEASETFVFYPEFFEREVPNNSEIFNYSDWIKDGPDLRIGWQDRDAGIKAEYPGVTTAFDPGPKVGFECASADNLIFAGAQFHQTVPQTGDLTRFSIDFRLVPLDQHGAGKGAPNIDDRSRGSALGDYFHPPAR